MRGESDEPGWLYLHVGHGRTGSSYLQAWLAINAQVLADRHDLAYPLRSPVSGHVESEAARSRFSMGNGYILEEVLELDDEPARQALQSASRLSTGQARSLIFSRERFMRSLAPHLDRIEALALAGGFRGVRYLVFLRDPLEHALSLYAQMVKAHGYTKGPDAWLAEYDLLDHVETFLAGVERLTRSELTVVNYSRARGHVLDRLRSWLGLTTEVLPLPERERVNRSLTGPELRVQTVCNRLFGPTAAAIGRRLVEELPSIPAAAPQVSVGAREAFAQRLEPQVQRLNRSLPQAERYLLDLSSAAPATGGPSALSGTQLKIVCSELPRCVVRWLGSKVTR